MLNNHMKLGKKSARVDPRTFKLSSYLPTLLPPVKGEMGYITQVKAWPMMLNDQLGCCTCSAAGHMVQQWTNYANPPGVIPSDENVLKMYKAVGGYVEGEPWTDNGAVMLDVLKYWRKQGIGGRQILGFAAVDLTKPEEVKQAVSLFASCYIGLQLPLSAQDQDVWAMASSGTTGLGEPGSWGGHAVPIVGYGLSGVMAVSWGKLYPITWHFLKNYCDEAYAVLSSDWISTLYHKAPCRFDLQQLALDLQSL